MPWAPDSWRSRPAAQQPVWPDEGELKRVHAQMSGLPPLVFAGEARHLTRSLAAAAGGRAFVLQAGDCAESFSEFGADSIRDKLKVILQMAVVLTYGAGVPVIKLGRIAGQFAKPRSSPTEEIGGRVLDSFRGHMVNDDLPEPSARVPDPNRLVAAYHQSVATLNLLRAFTKGGFADLSQIHAWNQEFVASSSQGQRFILDYEEALTRRDSLTDEWYDCSAHMLWVGERTRQLDGAHCEFLSGIHNPVGSKVGPSAGPDDVLGLCERLNPDRIPGRLTLITRMGVDHVATALPPLLRAVREEGHPVVWVCDPMHGNTFTAEGGQKTRRFDDIISELKGFFLAHRETGTWPGGVHVELTGDDVTECLGGVEDIAEDQLHQRYTTTCDPRLNGRQSLDLAFGVAELLRG
jgi:3-deoxy-7-phosphoheptulonate synthase